MTPEIRRVANVILLMFLSLFIAASAMQVVNADSLSNDSRNQRAVFDGYKTQRGAILVENQPIAESVPSSDAYHFLRKYSGPQYSAITGF
jgi:peptidoglycan glycosyltransferase